jgi:hypothetical protein
MQVAHRTASLLILVVVAAGCSQDGLPEGLAGGLADDLKHFDSGPVLASLDRMVAADRLAHHKRLIEERGFSYTVGDNPAMHRDLSQLAGLVRPDVVPKGDEEPLPPLLGDPPSRWDWREQGAGLPPARDQGTCGSCWAFSTVAALETAVAAFDGEHVDLSEQYLVDCNTMGYGCGGGFYVHEMHQDPGAVWERDYPYTAYDGSCRSSGLEHPYKILRSGSVEAGNIAQIKQAIYQYGSVSVSMYACGSIPGYTGGVYDSTECNYGMTNHAVSLVGWDDTVTHAQGTGVWIMRNSWGAGWGEDGYMRVAYGVAQVAEVDATYVEYEPTDPTDTDGDGVIDLRDNCPEIDNADQLDADLDGQGDVCDSSFDPIERSITLADDDSQSIGLGFEFPFFGETYTEVNINSDGNLTFGSADGQSEARSQQRFLTGPPRVAVLYADLNPSSGGNVTYRKDDASTLTVTWQGVPEYSRSGGGGSNTASVTLHASGQIEVTVDSNSTAGNDPRCIVGISRGGTGNNAAESDLSGETSGSINYEGTTAVFETFSASDSFDLTGVTLRFSGTVEPNMAPTASIDASPRSGSPPLEVSFTANAADEDGEVIAYDWDFGDRTVSDKQTTTKVFEYEGQYTVTLTVTDDQGGTGTATAVIVVGEGVPETDGDGDGDADGDGDSDGDGDGDGDGDDPGGEGPGGVPMAGEGPISTMFGYGACSAAPTRAAAPGGALWMLLGLASAWAFSRPRRSRPGAR